MVITFVVLLGVSVNSALAADHNIAKRGRIQLATDVGLGAFNSWASSDTHTPRCPAGRPGGDRRCHAERQAVCSRDR